MKTIYSLPCACGRKHPVNRTQAGETVHCPCGAALTVPALRELSGLESVVTTDTGRARRGTRPWDRRKSRILLGAVVTIAAGALLMRLELTRPGMPRVETLAPMQVWLIWQDLRRGPDRHLAPGEQQILDDLRMHRTQKTALLVCAAAGLLLMAISYAIPAPQAPRHVRPAPRAVA